MVLSHIKIKYYCHNIWNYILGTRTNDKSKIIIRKMFKQML